MNLQELMNEEYIFEDTVKDILKFIKNSESKKDFISLMKLYTDLQNATIIEITPKDFTQSKLKLEDYDALVAIVLREGIEQFVIVDFNEKHCKYPYKLPSERTPLNNGYISSKPISGIKAIKEFVSKNQIVKIFAFEVKSTKELQKARRDSRDAASMRLDYLRNNKLSAITNLDYNNSQMVRNMKLNRRTSKPYVWTGD